MSPDCKTKQSDTQVVLDTSKRGGKCGGKGQT